MTTLSPRIYGGTPRNQSFDHWMSRNVVLRRVARAPPHVIVPAAVKDRRSHEAQFGHRKHIDEDDAGEVGHAEIIAGEIFLSA